MPASWSTKIRTGGLAVILMRAGLKIDKKAFRAAGRVVLRLALMPMLCEAVVDSICFYWWRLPCVCLLAHAGMDSLRACGQAKTAFACNLRKLIATCSDGSCVVH